MEMKIKDDKFFVLEVEQDKWIVDTESNAIKSMRELISKTANLSPENVSILEINVKEKKWEIKELPWSRIAIALIKGEV
jgi:phenylpyruvate tautomerase PptA (4-oxalocrotonate tautomerase family)